MFHPIDSCPYSGTLSSGDRHGNAEALSMRKANLALKVCAAMLVPSAGSTRAGHHDADGTNLGHLGESAN
jgi:hypothetical protein